MDDSPAHGAVWPELGTPGHRRARATLIGLNPPRIKVLPLFLVLAAPTSGFAQGVPAKSGPAVAATRETPRREVRAIRLDEPIELDGRLDEPVYASTPPTSGLIQIEPDGGAPASQPVDLWFLFDDERVHVAARIFEAYPERMIANEMRHDNPALAQTELFVVLFDTFHDRRNAYQFFINPLGGRGEAQISNERHMNLDWYGVWDAAIGQFDGGWSVELAIPFKTLRYRAGSSQVWGVQIQRLNRWKNEVALLTPIDPALGQRGAFQVSEFATLVGLEAPPPSMNLEIQPYLVSGLATDTTASPPLSNDAQIDAGIDLKYAVTEGLTADVTVNTDFAQVEADEQQVNLTRFSLFFPEKRAFFLENAGMFSFGGANPGVQGATDDTPILFYSRRIGLNGSQEVPLLAGGRLTGRVGSYSVGVLNVESKDEPLSGARATNFSVVRLKRDILRRSTVGILATRRSVAQDGGGSNEAYGVDATFAFFSNLAINTYWARTVTPDLRSEDVSYRAQLDYAGDRYGVQLEHLLVGDHFKPEVGFVGRDDMRKNAAQIRFSPRPKDPHLVRKYTYVGSWSDIADTQGHPESREAFGEFDVEFQSSDKLTVGYYQLYERLPETFAVAPDVHIPMGGYDFGFVRASFAFGQHRALDGTLSVERGDFYDGERTTLGFRRGRLKATSRLSLEPTVEVNWVDLPAGAFTATLVGSRTTYTVSPTMFVSALMQYNSSTSTVSTNVRFRWEYLPGSEVFIVLNDQRDRAAGGALDLTSRALIVKVNRLLQF